MEEINLLLIEDELSFVEILEELFSENDNNYGFFKFKPINRIKTAIEDLKKNTYDLILLDLNLPDSNGYETFQKLKDNNIDIPIIILTNSSDESSISKYIKDGAQDYIIKSELSEYHLIRAIKHAIERYRLHKNLIDAKEEISNFSKIIAHDLKKPIHSVISVVRNMSEMTTDPKSNINEIKKALLAMKEQLFNISEIIDNLLIYSFLESRTRDFDDFNLTTCLVKVTDTLKKQIDEKNVNISYDKLPLVYGNEPLIYIVLQNLIENAIKYNNSNVPQINIEAFKKQDYIEINVKDNGIGIPKEKKDEVFKLYSKLGNMKNSHGLGLATCKKIVEFHKGSISLESELGLGSNFKIKIPKRKKTNNNELE